MGGISEEEKQKGIQTSPRRKQDAEDRMNTERRIVPVRSAKTHGHQSMKIGISKNGNTRDMNNNCSQMDGSTY